MRKGDPRFIPRQGRTGEGENTHGKLQVYEHRRHDRQDIVRIGDREIGEERDAALVELLERERAETLDAEEHAERDGELEEGHHEHGEHAHAGLFVHAMLLDRDALHRDLVPGLVRLFELRLELEQPRLEGRERRRVAQLFDGEGEQEQTREYRARDDGVEPRQTGGDVDQLEQPRGQARGRPPGEPERCEVAVLQGRERREGIDRVGLH